MSASDSPTIRDPDGDSEEARTLHDQAMVFRSAQDLTKMRTPKKPMKRATKEKLKIRACTPAPPSKGPGRKRFDVSPFPEDKQPRKRIDFGDEVECSHGLVETSKPTSREMGEIPIKENREMAMVCYSQPRPAVPSPEPGLVAGEVRTAGQQEDKVVYHPWAKTNESNNSNDSLVGEKVKLPEMDTETKSLLERNLVACQDGKSHDPLAVSLHVQPKINSLLHLANPNSSDVLDSMAAQPLLAGGRPETARSEVDLHTKTLTAPVPHPIIAPDALVVHVDEALMAEPLPVPQPGIPNLGQIVENVKMEVLNDDLLEKSDGELGKGWPLPAPPGSGAVFSAPLEEFPPLEKGRIMKIHDRFEAVSKNRDNGSRGSSRGPGHQASVGRDVQVDVSMTGPSAELLGLEDQNIRGPVGHAVHPHSLPRPLRVMPGRLRGTT